MNDLDAVKRAIAILERAAEGPLFRVADAIEEARYLLWVTANAMHRRAQWRAAHARKRGAK